MSAYKIACGLMLLAGAACAQDRTFPTPTIPLWEKGAPGALGTAESDIPAVTVYLPFREPTGTAVVICPGGGYGGLALNLEGRQLANWFNGMGMTAFVLRYRLGPRYHHPIELGDAQRAIRFVRAHAKDYGLKADRIGIMGFSAGGHLASTAGTHFAEGDASAADPIDRVSSRPDFLILGYPVISFTAPYTHTGSMRNLLGDNPDPKLREELSNELRVTPKTPPTFLFHGDADTGVPSENSVAFYLALRKARVPAEMHIFRSGEHGTGMGLSDPALSDWTRLLMEWMRGLGLVPMSKW